MKYLSIILILFLASVAAGVVYAQPFNTLWYQEGSNVFPVENWEIGSNANRILKAWLTDLDVSGVLTLGGAAGGNIDMNSNLLLNIGATGTDFTTGGGLTLSVPLPLSSGGTGTTTAPSEGYLWIGGTSGLLQIASSTLGGGANTSLSNLGITSINTSLVSDTDSTDNLGSPTAFWANAYLDKIYISNTLASTDVSFYGFTSGATRHQGVYLESISGYPYLIFKGKNDDAGQIYFESTNYTKASGNAAYIMYWQDDLTIFVPAGGKIDIDSGSGMMTLSDYVITTNQDFRPQNDSLRNLGSSALYWLGAYTDKLYLNSTAIFDGATAGLANLTGRLQVSATSTFMGNIIQNANRCIYDGIYYHVETVASTTATPSWATSTSCY